MYFKQLLTASSNNLIGLMYVLNIPEAMFLPYLGALWNIALLMF